MCVIRERIGPTRLPLPSNTRSPSWLGRSLLLEGLRLHDAAGLEELEAAGVAPLQGLAQPATRGRGVLHDVACSMTWRASRRFKDSTCQVERSTSTDWKAATAESLSSSASSTVCSTRDSSKSDSRRDRSESSRLTAPPSLEQRRTI